MMNFQRVSLRAAHFTKLVLDILFVLGIAATVSVPWSFRLAAKLYPELQRHISVQIVLFMLSAVGAVAIIYELRRMFHTVLAQDCFVRQNVKSLLRMAYEAFAIAAVTAVRALVVFTPATLLIIGVFFLAGLFSLVLSQVFDRAVSYKEENDLTI